MTMKNLPALDEKALPKGVAQGVRDYDESLRNAWRWVDGAAHQAWSSSKDMQTAIPGAELAKLLGDHARHGDDMKGALERRQNELIKALAKIGSK